MNLLLIGADLAAGWCTWSLAHNLGHRWWHDEMRQGKQTVYAHGEREHHRVYDNHGQRDLHIAEDPKELFISFPFFAVAPVALLLVAAYGWLRGWMHSVPFGTAMYACMFADHRLHILFHKSPKLGGILGRFQQMHMIHHRTHRHNYFFFSGFLWDALFRTARTKLDANLIGGTDGGFGSSSADFTQTGPTLVR
ncbi:MAG TPA: hypothetical protein VNY05_46320 [Candidatus Acidoferrales bacterium]|nr:hypothetical protein [Candidatus Acidoferrales bacterium]